MALEVKYLFLQKKTAYTVYQGIHIGRCDWAKWVLLSLRVHCCSKVKSHCTHCEQKCKELNNDDCLCTKERVCGADGGAVTRVFSLCGLHQMQLKCCYQRQPGPRAKLKYPNATPSSPLYPPPPPSSPSLPCLHPIPTPAPPLQQNFHILIQ